MKKNSICKIIVSGLLAVVPLMGMLSRFVVISLGLYVWRNQKWCVVPNLGNWIFRPV